MAEKETLREFLVSLGFKVDSASERRFTDSVASATKTVFALGAAVSAAGVVIVAGVERIARKFEGLFYSSQRVGASIASIKSFAYAAAQLGSSVEEATGSLESFGRKLRENPQGYAGWLQGLGVQVRKGNGELRDSVDILRDLGRQLAKKPYAQSLPYWELIGIDENTARALMDPSFSRRAEEQKSILSRMGFDPEKLGRDSVQIENAFRKIGAVFEEIWNKVASVLTGQVGNLLTRFSDWLVNNSGDIAKRLADITKWILELAEKLGKFLYDQATPQRLDAFVESLKNGATWLGRMAESARKLAESLMGMMNSPIAKFFMSGSLGMPGGMFGGYGDGALVGPPAASPAGPNAGQPWVADTPNAAKPWYHPERLKEAWRGRPKWLGGTGEGSSAPVPPSRPQLDGGAAPARLRGGWWTPERRAHAIDYLMKEAGLSEHGAAGLVARWAAVEAAGGPASVNPNSGAFGIAQWLGSRKPAIAGNTDFDAQLAHAAKELNSYESKAAEVLRNARTPEEGSRGASMFERAEGYNPSTGYDLFTHRTPTAAVHAERFGKKAVDARAANYAGYEAEAARKRAEFAKMSNAGIHPSAPIGVTPSITNDNSKSNTINAPSNITINGVSDPHEVARHLQLAGSRVAANILRNTQGATQ